MISFEIAKKLKEAGLQWKYNQGDCCYHILSTTIDNYNNENYTGIITNTYKYPGNKFVYSGEWGFGFNYDDEDAEDEIKRLIKYHIFAPTLSQMLIEIDKQKYESVKLEYWRDWNEGKGVWQFMIWKGMWYEFKSDIPEEAVALALISVLKKEI